MNDVVNYCEVDPARIDPARQKVALDVWTFVAAELGFTKAPALRWFSQETEDEAKLRADVGDEVMWPIVIKRDQPIWGLAKTHLGQVWVRADIGLADTAEAVAHELFHAAHHVGQTARETAEGKGEPEALAYGLRVRALFVEKQGKSGLTPTPPPASFAMVASPKKTERIEAGIYARKA